MGAGFGGAGMAKLTLRPDDLPDEALALGGAAGTIKNGVEDDDNFFPVVNVAGSDTILSDSTCGLDKRATSPGSTVQVMFAGAHRGRVRTRRSEKGMKDI